MQKVSWMVFLKKRGVAWGGRFLRCGSWEVGDAQGNRSGGVHAAVCWLRAEATGLSFVTSTRGQLALLPVWIVSKQRQSSRTVCPCLTHTPGRWSVTRCACLEGAHPRGACRLPRATGSGPLPMKASTTAAGDAIAPSTSHPSASAVTFYNLGLFSSPLDIKYWKSKISIDKRR